MFMSLFGFGIGMMFASYLIHIVVLFMDPLYGGYIRMVLIRV